MLVYLPLLYWVYFLKFLVTDHTREYVWDISQIMSYNNNRNGKMDNFLLSVFEVSWCLEMTPGNFLETLKEMMEIIHRQT